MSDRHVNLPGTLGGDDGPTFDEVDAYIATQEDASGMPEAITEWATRNRLVALCKRHGHDWMTYAGIDENGPYRECGRCGERGVVTGQRNDGTGDREGRSLTRSATNTPPPEGVYGSDRKSALSLSDRINREADVSLAQIVAALSVTYKDEGVVMWLNSQGQSLADGRLAEVAEAVRRIGDADPSDFTVTEPS